MPKIKKKKNKLKNNVAFIIIKFKLTYLLVYVCMSQILQAELELPRLTELRFYMLVHFR